MKNKKFLTLLTLVVLLAITATTVWAAASPYLIDPFNMTDPLDPSVTWPRDTTNQNAIAQHSEDQFTGQVYQLYSSSKLVVQVYVSTRGANTTAIMGPNNLFIVGPSGGQMEAYYAKDAISHSYPPINAKNLIGVIYTGATPEETWGTEYWKRYTNPPVYASASYSDAYAARSVVNDAITAREDSAYGRQLAWGPDGFLGLGTMKDYRPWQKVPLYLTPTNLLSEETTLYVDTIPVTLIPNSDSDGRLLVWLPNQRILFGGDFGQYLPDAGSIHQPGVSIPKRINALNQIMNLEPLTVVPVHGMYISGQEAIDAALTAQRDALQSIYDQTLVRINAGDTIDEAAVAVTLPADLAASPYNQEFVSTVPGIVRSIYQEKMGWFGGNPIELTSTLTEAGKAQALVAAFAYPSLTEAAKQAELSAQDLPAAEKALYLAFMAYKSNPDDVTSKQIYAQALLKNAYLQKSAQTRNYYLSAAHGLGLAQNGDFSKIVLQNTPLTFTAEDFSSHFTGLFGEPLTAIKITSWPHGGRLSPFFYDDIVYVSALGMLVYTPFQGWTGTDSFTWNGYDQGGHATASATVTLIVTPPPTASIAGTVFNDANANGAPDADEGGLAGIPLDLQDAGGVVVNSATSGSDGSYAFTGLAAGSYTVAATIDSARAQTTTNPASVTLDSNSSAVTGVNFGSLLPAGSISGLVFNDANGSGAQDSGEVGLEGVTVSLLDANGNQTQATTTADGTYAFTGLYAGTYQVSEVLASDRVQTTSNPALIPLTVTQAVTGVNFGSVVSADLRVSMTYSVNSKKIIYAITVTNDGPADALSAALTDLLPDTVAYISVISTQGTCAGGKTVNCDFGTIASGGSVTVTIQVNRVNTKIAVVNNATVTSTIFDIDMADNSVSTTIP
jgi:uncharacterized repeat protein (TIGR01451 family)